MSPIFRRRAAGPRDISAPVDLWMAATVFFLPLLASLPFLGADPQTGDYAGFALGAKTLGVLPPPGYPLYLLVAHFDLRLPGWGSDLWRLNALGAFCTSLGSLLLYLCARRMRFFPAVAGAASLAFAFSPFIWRGSFPPSPYAFHFFLLALCLWLTLHLFREGDAPPSAALLLVWGCLCGLTGGQEPSLLAWTGPALILGLTLGLPRRRTRSVHYAAALAGFACGLILPYLYLPLRVFAPGAFIDTQFVPQFSELRQLSSLSPALSWMSWYLTIGAQLVHLTGPGLDAALRDFFSAFPFIGLALLAFGGFLNLLDLLFERPRFQAAAADSLARLAAGSLPLIALPALFLLWPRATPQLELSLSLTFFLWGLAAFEYAYLELGNPNDLGDKPVHPTGFGYLFLLIVPLLIYWHSFPDFRSQFRRPAAPGLTLSRTRADLQRLPPGGTVIFLDNRLSYPFHYLRLSERLRPDALLLSGFDPWPKRGYSGRQSMEIFRDSWREALRRRRNFAEYWNQSLSSELAEGRTVFWLAQPQLESARIAEFLTEFDLAAEPEAANRDRTGPGGFPALARVQPAPAAHLLAAAPPAAAVFDHSLGLLSARILEPVEPAGRLAVLRFALSWQASRPLAADAYRVKFRIAPLSSEARRAMNRPWRAERRLLRVRGAERLPAQPFEETYQLLAPVSLPAGRYRLQVSVVDAANRPLPLSRKRTYFALGCDFTVPAAGLPAVLRDGASVPGVASNSVPGK